ncbi:MAG: hypothetical protein AAF802_21980 [Planctomycetota bacterium]
MPTELYAQLSASLSEGEFDQALQHAEEICRVCPEDGGAYEMRGLLAAKTGRPNLAVHYLETAKRFLPLEPLSVRLLGFAYLALGREEHGIRLLRDVASEHASEPAFNRLIGRDLLGQGYANHAIQVLTEGVQCNPDEHATWHELGAAQSVAGLSPAQCLDSVRKAIALEPNTTSYRVTASSLLIRLDRIVEAYQTVCQVISPDSCRLSCTCCLWRLIFLFDCFDDHARMKRCYTQLEKCRKQELT